MYCHSTWIIVIIVNGHSKWTSGTEKHRDCLRYVRFSEHCQLIFNPQTTSSLDVGHRACNHLLINKKWTSQKREVLMICWGLRPTTIRYSALMRSKCVTLCWLIVFWPFTLTNIVSRGPELRDQVKFSETRKWLQLLCHYPLRNKHFPPQFINAPLPRPPQSIRLTLLCHPPRSPHCYPVSGSLCGCTMPGWAIVPSLCPECVQPQTTHNRMTSTLSSSTVQSRWGATRLCQ